MQLVVQFFRRINYLFLGLVVLLLLFNAGWWASHYFPRLDTLQVFNHFYHSYNHFYFNSSLPLWNAFEAFGQDSAFEYLNKMTPFMTFSMSVGKFFDIKNVLHLFKFAVLLEQGVLLVGTYLLARQLFIYKQYLRQL